MAVLSGATASGRVMYSNSLPTAQGTLYTAPSASSNVTSPSATAYVKEIAICNTTASAVTVTILINGIYFMSGVSVSANDTKVLSGLNSMLSAGQTISGNASVAGINCLISGVEIQ